MTFEVRLKRHELNRKTLARTMRSLRNFLSTSFEQVIQMMYSIVCTIVGDLYFFINVEGIISIFIV